jgi:MFS family permease
MNSSESQIGLIWLAGFLPHLSGVYLVIILVKRYASYQFVFIMAGLTLEALSCLWIPFITSYYVLFIPICIICFGYGLIDATILPTMAYLVDTRHASIYGSVYAIVDISYSSVYCFGPILSGVLLHFIGFVGMSIILCGIILVFVPIVYILKRIYFLKASDDSAIRAINASNF